MNIQLQHLSRSFGNFQALRDVSLDIQHGELLALLGPSGSGKTTLLRIIAGLEQAETGKVIFDGQDASRQSAAQRRVGFVFQHYALFRHMTVFDNVAFSLRLKPRKIRPSKVEIAKKVNDLLELLQIGWLGKQYPATLSGGQRQRVALARALVSEPRVLLLDEPFGALDAKVRKELRRWLRRLHDDMHITSIFVTHDQEEALEVADRVVIMSQGQIEQIGTPAEVYDQPKNSFVYEFLGNVNLFHGRVEEGVARFSGLDVAVPNDNHQSAPAVAYVRPHDFEVRRDRPSHSYSEATVRHIAPMGAMVQVEMIDSTREGVIEVQIPKDVFGKLAIESGHRLFIRPRHISVFAGDKSAAVEKLPVRVNQ